jgi:hypothetical protein
VYLTGAKSGDAVVDTAFAALLCGHLIFSTTQPMNLPHIKRPPKTFGGLW